MWQEIVRRNAVVLWYIYSPSCCVSFCFVLHPSAIDLRLPHRGSSISRDHGYRFKQQRVLHLTLFFIYRRARWRMMDLVCVQNHFLAVWILRAEPTFKNYPWSIVHDALCALWHMMQSQILSPIGQAIVDWRRQHCLLIILCFLVFLRNNVGIGCGSSCIIVCARFISTCSIVGR